MYISEMPLSLWGDVLPKTLMGSETGVDPRRLHLESFWGCFWRLCDLSTHQCKLFEHHSKSQEQRNKRSKVLPAVPLQVFPGWARRSHHLFLFPQPSHGAVLIEASTDTSSHLSASQALPPGDSACGGGFCSQHLVPAEAFQGS